MSEPATHLAIDRGLCGAPIAVEDGFAAVTLTASTAMSVDDRGLVHGGFVFGLADHAAMLAVNHPLVVLGSADVRFSAPVRVGDDVVAEARVVTRDGAKHSIEVTARVGETRVLSGSLTAFVLERHVLDGRPA